MKECTYSMRKSCKIWSACSEAYGGGEDLPPCTKESQTTDTQQLKAKIAALMVPAFIALRNGNLVEASECIDKLRQLSAV